MQRSLFAACVVGSMLVGLTWAVGLHAQTSAGEQVFKDRCASCHSGAPESRAPAPDSLRTRSSQAIVESLVNGAMRVQGSRMTGAERRAVAEFLTGKPIAGDVTGIGGRCASMQQADRTGRSGWRGWSPSPDNTRAQPADRADLRPGDIPKLTLKWSFAFPDASSAWAQPTVAGDRLFVGSQNGTIFALGRTSGLLGSIPEVDSMAVVQILTTIEEHFGISIPDDEISADAFATLGSLADLVQARLE